MSPSPATAILRHITLAWSTLTVLLGLAGVLLLVFKPGALIFVVLSNSLNALLLTGFLLLRDRLARVIAAIDDAQPRAVSIQYAHEKPIGMILSAGFAVFACVIVLTASFDANAYRTLIDEDAAVEYGSALFWFLSAVITGCYTILLAARERRWQFLVPHALLTSFFFVCCGEEISWGQRLLGIESSELIKSVNIQEETNLHNIGSISVFSNAFFLLTVLHFVCVPFYATANPRLKTVLHSVHFPVPHKTAVSVYLGSLCVWVFVGLRFGTLGFHPFSLYPEQYYTQMDDEIFEFLAAYSFLCFSILNSMQQVTVTSRAAAPRVLQGTARGKTLAEAQQG